MKPVALRVFGRVSDGIQRLTIQVTSRRTGRTCAIGVEFSHTDDSWAPLQLRNRRLVRYAWLQLRGLLRANRGAHALAAIHIKGTVSI